MALRGRAVAVVAADTDTNVLADLTGKERKITRILLSNNGPGATRVRVWDTFTETDTTVHSTSALPVPVIDRNLVAGETVELVEPEGVFTSIGLLIAQATVAAAFPNDVTVGLWGEAE